MTPRSKKFKRQQTHKKGVTRYIAKFKANKWCTHGAFAFAAGFATSEPCEEVFNAKELVPILGSVDHDDAPSVRRLWYESLTAVASDMRQRCEHTSDTAPLQVTQHERVARREFEIAKVAGEKNVSDIFTKSCPGVLLQRHMEKLGQVAVKPSHLHKTV